MAFSKQNEQFQHSEHNPIRTPEDEGTPESLDLEQIDFDLTDNQPAPVDHQGGEAGHGGGDDTLPEPPTAEEPEEPELSDRAKQRAERKLARAEARAAKWERKRETLLRIR